MTSYYVIFKIQDGVEQDAYIINSCDNDLDYHLSQFGDMSITYEEYKDEDEATDRKETYNRSLWERGNK